LNRTTLTTLALIGLVATAVTVGAIVYYTLRVRGSGVIKVVGLKCFSDPELTKEVSALDWGTINPGGVSQVTLYLKSTSSVPGTMTQSTEAWDPLQAGDFLVLTWDYDGHVIQPKEVVTVILTLTVSPDVIGITAFSFDIVLTMSG